MMDFVEAPSCAGAKRSNLRQFRFWLQPPARVVLFLCSHYADHESKSMTLEKSNDAPRDLGLSGVYLPCIVFGNSISSING